jgi:hypothetical protein
MMGNTSTPDSGRRSRRASAPSETQSLYIAQVPVTRGWLLVNGKQVPALLTGELQFEGYVSEGQVSIRRWRRVAVAGQLETPEEIDRGGRVGIISLAGDSIDESRDSLSLQLHYAELTRRVRHADPESDVLFPDFRYVKGSIRVKKAESTSESDVWLSANLLVSGLGSETEGLLAEIKLDVQNAHFRQAGLPRQQLRALYSLPATSSLSAGDCLPPAEPKDNGYRLGIRFISCSTTYTLSNPVPWDRLRSLCEEQLEGARLIWREQGALTVLGPLVDGTPSHKAYTVVDANADQIFELMPANAPTSGDFRALAQWEMPVYIVDTLKSCSGGAITVGAGAPSAYCVMSIGFLQGNPNLLAHEIGHVLGLDEPGSPRHRNDPAPYNSSAGSVMSQGAQILRINTRFNIRILFPRPNDRRGQEVTNLNPLAVSTGVADCLRPNVLT